MRKHYFSKRRSRRRTRSKSRRKSRKRRSSKRKSRRRKRRSTKRMRVGKFVHMANGKKLKIQKDKDGNEFVRSGKSKTKSYVGKTGKKIKKKHKSRKSKRRRKTKSRRRRKSKSRRRRKSKSRRRRKTKSRRRKRSFGRKKKKFGRQAGLTSIMGNYSPSKMNTFQQYTGMSAPQMQKHMSKVLNSDKANFYTSV